MRRLLIGSLTFAATLSAAAVTQAHLVLTAPPPRHATMLKAGPCGAGANDARGATITEYMAGQTITVQWDETIDHPGHYRILFAQDGFAFPNPANENDFCTPGTEISPGILCLADNIADQAGGPNYSMTVTLPDVACDNCTLQVIQYMTDKLNDGIDNELYFQCADLVLQGAGGAGGGMPTTSSTTTGAGGAGGDPGTGGSTGEGTGGSGGEAPTSGDYDPYPDDSSCAVGRGQGSAALAAAAVLGLLALFSRRRRSGR